MVIIVVFAAVSLAVTAVAARATYGAWNEWRSVRRVRELRSAALDPSADALAIIRRDELPSLIILSSGRHVRFSRLTGWKVEDPRNPTCTVPPHLYPVYANRFREAADLAAMVAELVIVLAGAALGYVVTGLVAGFSRGGQQFALPLYVAMGLVALVVIAVLLRLWIVREWSSVAGRFHALAVERQRMSGAAPRRRRHWKSWG